MDGSQRRQVKREVVLRDEAEERVASRRDRHRDGQHVVDDQRAARDDAGPLAQQLGRDHVAAAAMRELLDNAAVRGGDDHNRQRHRHGNAERQVRVRAERLERLLRTVGRRREAVRAQAHPGQERDQRERVEDALFLYVARRAKDGPAQAGDPGGAFFERHSRGKRRLAWNVLVWCRGPRLCFWLGRLWLGRLWLGRGLLLRLRRHSVTTGRASFTAASDGRRGWRSNAPSQALWTRAGDMPRRHPARAAEPYCVRVVSAT
jgi:hypothetical protein